MSSSGQRDLGFDYLCQRQVKKTYIAFAQGAISKAAGEIKSPIAGLNALTRYRVIHKKKYFTVAEVIPLTGRTNQIRIHFKRIGHPLVGETKFAFRRDSTVKARRVCLHAQSLEFDHPFKKEQVRINIGLPRDLEVFLEKHAA